MTAPAQVVKSRMCARGSSACGRGADLVIPDAARRRSGTPGQRLKNRFGHLRLWVRLPGVTHLAFGHAFLTLDDDKAAVEGAHRSGRPPQQSEIR